MARPIPKFSERERNLVSQTLVERFGKAIPLQAIEAEIQLDLLKEDITPCPALTWREGICNFVIFKTGDSRFRCQFYYTDAEQFGTGQLEYDNLGDCAVELLQIQSKHEAERTKMLRGINAVDFSKANDGEDYHAPLII